MYRSLFWLRRTWSCCQLCRGPFVASPLVCVAFKPSVSDSTQLVLETGRLLRNPQGRFSLDHCRQEVKQPRSGILLFVLSELLFCLSLEVHTESGTVS